MREVQNTALCQDGLLGKVFSRGYHTSTEYTVTACGFQGNRMVNSSTAMGLEKLVTPSCGVTMAILSRLEECIRLKMKPDSKPNVRKDIVCIPVLFIVIIQDNTTYFSSHYM